MKIQIIRIEEFDNLFSLKEKITNAKAARVILSDNAGIHRSLKILKLLNWPNAAAQKAGKEIGIVTRDPDEMAILRELHMDNFPDLVSAQQYPVGISERRGSANIPDLSAPLKIHSFRRNNKTIPWLVTPYNFQLRNFRCHHSGIDLHPGSGN